MAMQITLSFNNGKQKLRLPVNPESIKISTPVSVQDIDVNKLGQYSVIGDPRLREYSLSSFFPSEYNETYCEYKDALLEPWRYVEVIEDWIASKQPIRLIVTGTPINQAVTIRSFNYDPDRAGAGGDIYYDLTLKDYTFVQFKRETTSAGAKVKATSTAARPDARITPSTYTVKSNDSLWDIAQRLLGSGSLYDKIYQANKSKIGKDPSNLKVGMELILPNDRA